MIKNDKALKDFTVQSSAGFLAGVDIYNTFGDNAMILRHDGTDFGIVVGNNSGTDLVVECNDGKTLRLAYPVYDDIRVLPSSFYLPGVSDPNIVAVNPGDGDAVYLCEFASGNVAGFSVQMPHNYMVGGDIKVHVHWTPGSRGNEENGHLVAWKVYYTWANVNGVFGAVADADCADACNGVDWEHNMSPEATISGSGKGISSMLICTISRISVNDTWSSTTSGQLPLILEVDFHYPIDTLGSRDWGSK